MEKLIEKVVSKGEFPWCKEDIYSCNACGSYGPLEGFKHYKGCGGMAELKKWEDYYNDPAWEKSFKEEEDNDEATI